MSKEVICIYDPKRLRLNQIEYKASNNIQDWINKYTRLKEEEKTIKNHEHKYYTRSKRSHITNNINTIDNSDNNNDNNNINNINTKVTNTDKKTFKKVNIYTNNSPSSRETFGKIESPKKLIDNISHKRYTYCINMLYQSIKIQ